MAGHRAAKVKRKKRRRLATARSCWPIPKPFSGECFDVVLVCGMMEFVNDPPVFLKQVEKAIASGGLLGLAVPHKQSFAIEKHFGILTHELTPMAETLRGCGLTQEWADDFNGYTLENGKVEVMYRGSVWSKATARS